MSEVTIYHNPRCTKSRQALQLLGEAGVDPKVVLYLETPLSAKDLQSLLKKLGIEARQLLRKTETAYKDLNLKDTSLTEKQLIQAMVENPKLIQRPIVVCGPKAVVARPPELVNQIC